MHLTASRFQDFANQRGGSPLAFGARNANNERGALIEKLSGRARNAGGQAGKHGVSLKNGIWPNRWRANNEIHVAQPPHIVGASDWIVAELSLVFLGNF